jgi:hypothetical protein
VLTLHVVEAHISSFGHDGIPERSALVVLDHPLDCGIANDADAEGVGDQIGVSRTPFSSTQCVPVMSPLPLPE